ncbi:MAG TPA: DUF4160 domain-containing protein [Solirubrobacterales bacterium]
MPTVSQFLGIQIRMFFNEDIHQGRPHFHAVYADAAAVFDASDSSRLAGELPLRAERLVRRWAKAHRRELLENWERARSGLDLQPIEPLK